jgi:hypothetical protein
MDKIALYRAKADECRMAADDAANADVREMFRELARRWDELADTFALAGLHRLDRQSDRQAS